MTLRHWDASFDLPKLFPKGPTMFRIFEANVDPITRLSTDTSVVVSGWVRLAKGTFRLTARGKSQKSTCDIDASADFSALTSLPDKQTVAPFLIGSFDIECVPEGGRGFPDPTKPLDQCVQIGTAVYRFGEDRPALNIVLALDTVEPVEGLVVRSFKTEKELLLAWRDLIVQELDLDLIVGHNIFKFDLHYVARRAQVLKIPGFFHLGRLRGQMTALKTRETNTKAYGHNEFHYLPMTGRMQMDIYQLIKKEHKLSSYKLDSIAKHFLKDEKDDVSPKQIFAFQIKDAKHRAIVAKYCAKDCELVYRLVKFLDILPQYIEMSKVTGVTMNDLNTRGQQIKVFTQIVQEAHASGFIVPELKSSPAGDDMQYQGAFVLRPQSGLYQEPIATLDFASLYPSIIRGDNLSYETLVMDESELDGDIEVSRIKVEQGTIYDVDVTLTKGSVHCVGVTDNPQFIKLSAILLQALASDRNAPVETVHSVCVHCDFGIEGLLAINTISAFSHLIYIVAGNSTVS
jgi:DNA polymerase delta subunit 1